MSVSTVRESDVLIVGAGPTGLVLALWLTRLGVRVRIIDKTAEPGTTSRALAVQARTLELYSQIGLADAVVERGRQSPRRESLGGRQEGRARRLRRHGRGPQPVSLRADLSARRARAPVDRSPRRGRRRSRAPDGAARASRSGGSRARASETAGWSRWRRARPPTSRAATARIPRCARRCGSAFPGGTYAHLFYVADVEASGAAMNGELHVALDTTDFLAVFPLKGDGRARLVGTVREEAEQPAREPVVERREPARDRVDAHRRRARELVLDLPRASSGRRSFPQAAARSCSATPRTSTVPSADRA